MMRKYSQGQGKIIYKFEINCTGILADIFKEIAGQMGISNYQFVRNPEGIGVYSRNRWTGIMEQIMVGVSM